MLFRKLPIVLLLLVGVFSGGTAPADDTQAIKPIAVSGRVLGTDGQPAADAKVTIRTHSPDGPVQTDATAGDDGQFEAVIRVKQELLPSVRVQASSADGSAIGYFRFPWNGEKEDADAVEIKLETTRQAAVKVVDGDGKPVSGARVAIQLGYPITIPEMATDESGRVELRLPESERIEAAIAWKAGVGLDFRLYRVSRYQRADVNAKPPEFPPEGETLTLDGTSPLTVRVVDDDGKPVSGVRLYPWLLRKDRMSDSLNLSCFSESFSQHSDEKGETTFAWMPSWQQTPLTVWPTAPGFSRLRGDYDPQTGSGRLEMQLDRLVPIRGRVVDADGKPRGDVTIEARGAGYAMDSGSASTLTDQDGRYELLVPPDQIYLVIVRDDQWAASPHDGFAVRKNEPIEQKDFVLRKATRVFGTLTDEKSGKPLPDQRVIIYQYGQDLHSMQGVTLPNPENSRSYVRPTQFHNATTDEQGRFEFALGDGEFDIRPPRQEKADKFTINGQPDLELQVTTKIRQEVELVGLVLSAESQEPLAGVRVSGVPQRFSSRDWQAETGEDGKFRVKRFREPTYVHAISADGRWGTIQQIGEEQNAFVMQLQEVGSAAGRLLETDSDDPAGKTKIRYGVRVPDENGRSWSYRFGGLIATQSDGTFHLPAMVPGWEYTLNLESRADGSIPTLTRVTVAAKESAQLGDLSIPAPRARPRPLTLEDRIQAAFDVKGTPIERHRRALETVDLVNQNLLVVFGVPDDSRIHRLMDIRYNDRDYRQVRDDYLLMAIPTDPEHHQDATALGETLGESLEKDRGEFLLVIVDREGNKVDTADHRSLCIDDELSKEKLIDWLRSHQTEPLDAQELLDETLKKAGEERKLVIVQETATWCGPCHLLSKFLRKHRVWEKDYLWVKIDQRWKGARQLMAEIRGDADGGIPWFAILDPDGEVLITSNDPKSGNNIGYPAEKSGQLHFANMLHATRLRMSEDDVDTLIQALEE